MPAQVTSSLSLVAQKPWKIIHDSILLSPSYLSEITVKVWGLSMTSPAKCDKIVWSKHATKQLLKDTTMMPPWLLGHVPSLSTCHVPGGDGPPCLFFFCWYETTMFMMKPIFTVEKAEPWERIKEYYWLFDELDSVWKESLSINLEILYAPFNMLCWVDSHSFMNND